MREIKCAASENKRFDYIIAYIPFIMLKYLIKLIYLAYLTASIELKIKTPLN